MIVFTRFGGHNSVHRDIQAQVKKIVLQKFHTSGWCGRALTVGAHNCKVSAMVGVCADVEDQIATVVTPQRME
jgi:hypothetical protein